MKYLHASFQEDVFLFAIVLAREHNEQNHHNSFKTQYNENAYKEKSLEYNVSN